MPLPGGSAIGSVVSGIAVTGVPGALRAVVVDCARDRHPNGPRPAARRGPGARAT